MEKTKNMEKVEYCIGVDIIGQPVFVIHYLQSKKKQNGKNKEQKESLL